MAIEQRGPFLLIFALDQQLAGLLGQTMREAPLKPGEFAVYSALRLEQPVTPTRLAAVLGMPATTLSSALRKMGGAGHLSRLPNPADGRSALIALTPAGIEVTEACFPAFRSAIDAFREQLTDELVTEHELLRVLEGASRAIAAASDQVGSRAIVLVQPA
jgi:DNA-binding MarR family transcriptional regulator